MRRPTAKRSQPGVALFPFLAVLICTMGSLIVLLVLVVQGAQASAAAERAAAKAKSKSTISAEELAARKQQVEDIQWQAEMLEKQRADFATKLQSKRLELSHLEDHLRRLEDEGKQIQAVADAMEHAGKDKLLDQEFAEERLADLQKQLAEKKRELDEAKKKNANKRPAYAIIPYEGPNGTSRRPIYIECREEGIVIQPEGVKFSPQDFEGPLGPGNPLDAALRAIREHQAAQGLVGEPYPLIIVRPNGAVAFGACRAAMKHWENEFGYELVEQEAELKYPTPDPRLTDTLQRTLRDARVRQTSLAAAMPNRFGAPGKLASFRVEQPEENTATAGSGGFGNGTGKSGGIGSGKSGGIGSGGIAGRGVGNGTGSGGNAGNGFGGTGNNGSGSSPPGSSLGMSGAGQYGAGANGQPATGNGLGGSGESMSNTNGGNGGTRTQTGGGQASGKQATNGQYAGGSTNPGTNGSATGSNASGGNGSSNSSGGNSSSGSRNSGSSTSMNSSGANGGMSGGSGAAGGAPSQATGDPMQQQSTTPSLNINQGGSQLSAKARKAIRNRDENWGLPDTTSRATAITRPIRVECHADKLLLIPDRNEGRVPLVVPIDNDLASQTEVLVGSVWKHMDRWGLAMSNGYWKPILAVEVKRGGEERFAELQAVLRGSGIEVERKK